MHHSTMDMGHGGMDHGGHDGMDMGQCNMNVSIYRYNYSIPIRLLGYAADINRCSSPGLQRTSASSLAAGALLAHSHFFSL